jgi:hypothetical protein
MAVGKSAIKAVESAIRRTSQVLIEEVSEIGSRGSAQRLYGLRQTLLVLAKVRGSFEPELMELTPATAEPLGFQTTNEIELDEEFEIEEPGTAVPEARLIGFRPRS